MSIGSKRSYNSTSSNTNYANVFAIPQEVRTKCSPMGSKEQNKNRTTTTTSTSLSFDSPSKESLASSQRRIYDHHKNSQKSSYFKKAEWSKPCGESFMAGVSRKSIGFCPPNIEQISKMSKAKQKFFLTQDPRMTHCLVNPELLQSKRQQTKEEEFNNLTNVVKYGQNIWDPVAKASSSEESFVCEKIDLENPLQLDFQGLDYKNTYQKDEQDQQNQRNYNRLERFMARKKIRSETKTNMDERFHQERLQVNYYNRHVSGGI